MYVFSSKHPLAFTLRVAYIENLVTKGIFVKNPFDSGYFNEVELADIGFKSIGSNVQISKNCTIIGISNISIGSNVRIDDYSIIAAGNGWLNIGSFVHIGGMCYLSAGDGITLEDFSGLSQGVKIYSRTDDYTGRSLTNPTIPEHFTSTTHGAVTLKKHVIIGSGTVILPKVTIGEGSSVGALSLVTKSLDPWGVFFGCPVKRLKNRSQRLLELETKLMEEITQQNQKQRLF
jgi:galactoside O-acetyltransferase